MKGSKESAVANISGDMNDRIEGQVNMSSVVYS